VRPSLKRHDFVFDQRTVRRLYEPKEQTMPSLTGVAATVS
jgi:hypothetical protein